MLLGIYSEFYDKKASVFPVTWTYYNIFMHSSGFLTMKDSILIRSIHLYIQFIFFLIFKLHKFFCSSICYMFSCHYSINVKRHCDKGNSSKRKYLIGSLIKLSEAWSCIIMAESMISHKCGAGEEAEIHKLRLDLTWAFETPKPTYSDTCIPTRPHPFQ